MSVNEELFDKFMREYVEYMDKYKDCLHKIVVASGKTKTSDYAFMNEVSLFNDILKFEVFEKENKSTKKTLIKYLYNVYMSGVVICNFENNSSSDVFMKFIEDFQKSLDLEVEKKSKESSGSNKKSIKKVPRKGPQDLLQNIMGNEILSNPQLMSIAQDIAKDIEKEKIDPMALLSSMMTGGSNQKVNKLIENISSKLETKIKNGEIDGDKLNEQASSLINTVQNSDIKNILPNLPNLSNLPKDLFKK